MQLALRLIAIVSFIVAIVWVVQVRALEPEPILAFLTGLTTLALSFSGEKKESGETLDQHNRRVMLNHVESFWVKGVLEKSLHGAALLELGIKEDPSAINYPWTIKKESTDETLPAGKSMLEIFNEIGAGRSLLILGAPGSGKTTMLLELTRQLIERARADETEPIPVVFNLASWTEKQTIANWLAAQLNIVYYVPKKTAPKWVSENKMLLLLDGLDEVKEERRAKCVETINQFRNEHGLTSLVICSRMQEYSATKAKLSFEGAIALQPLTSKQINSYFEQFGKSLAGVKQILKKDEALRELVETPLMLSIMTLAYKDKSSEELPRSKNIEEQRKHLFNTYIDRMFERSNRTRNSFFTKSQTLQYLGWLAKKMIQFNITTYELESMQPFWLEDKRLLRLYFLFVFLFGGLILGVFIPLSGMLLGLYSFGLIGGLFGMLFGGLASLSLSGFLGQAGSKMRDFIYIQMFDKSTWSWNPFLNISRQDLFNTIIYLVTIGSMVTLSVLAINTSPSGGAGEVAVEFTWVYLNLFMIWGLTLVRSIVISEEQIEETTIYPGQHLRNTFVNVFLKIILFALVATLINVLISVLVSRTHDLQISRLIGRIIPGLLFVEFVLFRPLIQHFSLRLILTINDCLPRSLITFLEYAIHLIFLRRVGGSYIFVHRLLMEHFAEMEVEKT